MLKWELGFTALDPPAPQASGDFDPLKRLIRRSVFRPGTPEPQMLTTR
jgi:hypothetical protein